MNELKPCPFCGCVDVIIVLDRVRCQACDATGPPDTTKNGVIASWNTRNDVEEEKSRVRPFFAVGGSYGY